MSFINFGKRYFPITRQNIESYKNEIWMRVILLFHIMTMIIWNPFRIPINRNKCTPYQLYTHLNLYDDTTTFPCTKNWFNIHEENQTSSCGFQVYKGEFFWLYQKTTNANPFLQTLFLPNISTLSATKRNCLTDTTRLKYSGFGIYYFVICLHLRLCVLV